MKNSIILPLFLGLVLAGCSRTETDSKKISSNDQPDASKPVVVDEKTTATQKDVSDQTKLAAVSAPAPGSSTGTAADRPLDISKTAPDPSQLAANPTPSASTDPKTSMTPTTPAAPVADPMIAESSRVAVDPSTDATPPANIAASETKSATSVGPGNWKLSASDIKSEFEASGRIVRSKPSVAGAPTGPMDPVLVTLVTQKLQADADLAALKLDVSAYQGIVTLTGSAHSLDQIGKAVGIAIDTDGVTNAVSTIKLAPTP